MDSLPGLKTCRKGLHQYSSDLKRCPECKKTTNREYSRRWRERNPEWQKEVNRRWRERNPERQKEVNRRWREQNPDRVKELNRLWREQNIDRVKELNRLWREQNIERHRENARSWYEQNSERAKENNSHWGKQNPEKVNAKSGKRRAAKKQAVAPWADLDAIKQIYAEAAELSKSTSIRHEVDHIYPLQSDYMCGLHVETNLQILTQSENASKNNRIWPGQLECQRLPIQQHGFDTAA
jgi:hypothetical protein